MSRRFQFTQRRTAKIAPLPAAPSPADVPVPPIGRRCRECTHAPSSSDIGHVGATGTLPACRCPVVHNLEKISRTHQSAALSQDGKYLAVGTLDGEVLVLDVEHSYDVLARTTLVKGNEVVALSLSTVMEEGQEVGCQERLLLSAVDNSGLLGLLSLVHANSPTNSSFTADLEVLEVKQVADVRLHTVGFAVDGRTIACGGVDKKLSILEWKRDHKDGSFLTVVKEKTMRGWLTCVDFSPNGELLAFGGDVKKLSVMRMTSNHKLSWERNTTGGSYAIKFAPSGQLLAVGGIDMKFTILEANSGESVYQHNLGSPLQSLSFSPDSRLVAFAGQDKRVTTLELSTFETAKQQSTRGDVFALLFTGNRKLITVLAGETFAEETLWEDDDEEDATDLRQITGGVTALSFSKNGQRLAYGGHGVWGVMCMATGDIIEETKMGSRGVLAISFSPDGQRLAVGGANSALITTWRGEGGSEQAATVRDLGVTMNATKFSPDGRLLAVRRPDKGLSVFDSKSGEVYYEHHPVWDETVRQWASGLDFSLDGKLLAFGGFVGHLIVVEVETWNVAHELKLTEGSSALSFSGNGTYLAFCGRDRKVTVLTVEDWELVCEVEMSDRPLNAICFSPDNFRLAVGGEDQKVIILETISWEILRQLDMGGAVMALSFSPSAPFLAVGIETKGLTMISVPRKTPTALDILVGAMKHRTAIREEAVARSLLRAPGLACRSWAELLPPIHDGFLMENPEVQQRGLLPQQLPLELLITSSGDCRNELPKIIEAVLDQSKGRLLLDAREARLGRLVSFLQRAATWDCCDFGMPALLVHAFVVMDRRMLEESSAPDDQLWPQQQPCYAPRFSRFIRTYLHNRCYSSANVEEAWRSCRQNISPAAPQLVKRQVVLCPGLAQPALLNVMLRLPPPLRTALFATETAGIVASAVISTRLVISMLFVRFLLRVSATFAMMRFSKLLLRPDCFWQRLGCLIPGTVTVILELLEVVGNAKFHWANRPQATTAWSGHRKLEEVEEQDDHEQLRPQGEKTQKLKVFLCCLLHHFYGWSILDLLPVMIMCAAMLSSQFFGGGENAAIDAGRPFLSFLSLFFGAAILHGFRHIPYVNHVPHLLTETFVDMIPFMYITSLVLLGIGRAISFALPEDSPGFSLLTVVGMGILGSFELARTSEDELDLATTNTTVENELDYSSWPALAIFFHLLLILFVLVIMMNLLISILGSTYERVMGMAAITSRIERAKVAASQVHLVHSLPHCRSQRIFSSVLALTPTAYFHRRVPITGIGTDGSLEETREDEWYSASTMLNKRMKRLQEKMELRMEGIEDRIEHRIEQLEAGPLAAMQSQIAAHSQMQIQMMEQFADVKRHLEILQSGLAAMQSSEQGKGQRHSISSQDDGANIAESSDPPPRQAAAVQGNTPVRRRRKHNGRQVPDT